jgi:DNA-binding NtrC family response regulator
MEPIRPVVFVVDDEKIIAETLAMILNQSGFSAIAFEDPREAILSAANSKEPQLLITDVVMPHMSGIELATHFRANYPGCRVLLFSGQAASASLLEAARADGHDFELLLKPVHPSDLLAKLRESLEDQNTGQPGTSAVLKHPAHI